MNKLSAREEEEEEEEGISSKKDGEHNAKLEDTEALKCELNEVHHTHTPGCRVFKQVHELNMELLESENEGSVLDANGTQSAIQALLKNLSHGCAPEDKSLPAIVNNGLNLLRNWPVLLEA